MNYYYKLPSMCIIDVLKFSKVETVATHEIPAYRRSIEGSERGRTNFSADCHIYNEPSDDMRLSGRGGAISELFFLLFFWFCFKKKEILFSLSPPPPPQHFTYFKYP